ncbi:YbhB/YbcL family Raf kinase inhibitor-like protein [Chitinibacter sp. SCUT-21]|uniref:YbhB/YbcL family Raf kinase inhibitor-like protein n=1 Tax=Chitinibacter sp. SCUT-21 TaxID=2970891 RepID=UPI0035A6FF8F
MKLLASLITSIVCLGNAYASDFQISSTDLKANQFMSKQHEFAGFGCNGGNISPQLQWKNAPAGTKSFAITVYDPDAPTGSGWWHWGVVNIPAQTMSVAAGQVPAGAVETRTDYGKAGYGGACPPVGDKAHRYIHTVWALDVEQLPLDSNASGALVGYMLNAHKLAKADLMTLYQRTK